MSINMMVDFQMDTESLNKFKKQLLAACAEQLTEIFNKSVISLFSKLPIFINEQIKNTDEYKAIINGKLHGELGLKNPSQSMQAVIDQIIESTEIKNNPVKIVGNKLVGGFTLRILPSNYKDILDLPESTYTSNDFQIPWLRWLLIEGDNILVGEYRVLSPLNAVQQKFSRSKKAIMIKKGGAKWKLPAQFQGVSTNNFILNAFISPEAEQKMFELFKNAVYSNLVEV